MDTLKKRFVNHTKNRHDCIDCGRPIYVGSSAIYIVTKGGWDFEYGYFDLGCASSAFYRDNECMKCGKDIEECQSEHYLCVSCEENRIG